MRAIHGADKEARVPHRRSMNPPRTDEEPDTVTCDTLWLRCGQSALSSDAAGFVEFLRQRRPFAHESLASLRGYIGGFPETRVQMPAATFDASRLRLLRTSPREKRAVLAQIARWRAMGHTLDGALLCDGHGRSRIVLDPQDDFIEAVDEIRVFQVVENEPLAGVPYKRLSLEGLRESCRGSGSESLADADLKRARLIVLSVLPRSDGRVDDRDTESIAVSYARRIRDEGLTEMIVVDIRKAYLQLDAIEHRPAPGRYVPGTYSDDFQFGEPMDSAGGAYARAPRS